MCICHIACWNVHSHISTETYYVVKNKEEATEMYIYSTLRGRIKGTASAAFVIQNRF